MYLYLSVNTRPDIAYPVHQLCAPHTGALAQQQPAAVERLIVLDITDADRGPLVLGDVCELALHGAHQDFAIFAQEPQLLRFMDLSIRFLEFHKVRFKFKCNTANWTMSLFTN